MSLHAEVSVPGSDRRRLERLCRYVARPPLAIERLEATSDGRLAYRLKTPWRDGTTHVLMERHELLERLAPLIPPPRAHQVRYHGVLAPCASGRDRVVPAEAENGDPVAASLNVVGAGKAGNLAPAADLVRSEPVAVDDQHVRLPLGALGATAARGDPMQSEAPGGGAIAPLGKCDGPPELAPSLSRPRHRWAEMLQRVFEIDALQCPRCGGRMRILAAITDPDVARRILMCLRLPPRAPPLELAVSPRPAVDSWIDAPESWDFDQTVPEDWDSGG